MSIQDIIQRDKITNAKLVPGARYYPKRHMAPQPYRGNALAWQNDGQNFVWDKQEGIWRTWALGNPDWTQADGFPLTEWIEYIGNDLTDMVPNGVRLDRISSPANTYWSGSCYVDWENHIGRGEGHAYYFVSGPAPVGQAIMLLTADKLGERPDYLGMCNVIDKVPQQFRDGGNDFRDCRVFWDETTAQLVMSATVGGGFAFFSSQNATDWSFLSYLRGPGPLVECPNMVQLPVRDQEGNDTGTTKWAIIGAVQGAYEGGTDSNECCAAWIGDWDGESFSAEAPPVPIDFGPDSYASVAGTGPDGQVYTGFWCGNWAYCLDLLPFSGFQNIQATPRKCWIQTDWNGVDRIYTQPLDNGQYSEVVAGTSQTSSGGNPYQTQESDTGDCFRLDVTLNQVNGAWPDNIVIGLRKGTIEEASFTTNLILSGKSGAITFDRSSAGFEYPNSPQPAPDSWNSTYSIPAALGLLNGTSATVSILVDTCCVEAFFNGGAASLAGLTFPPEGCTGWSITASGDVLVSATLSKYNAGKE